MLFIIIAFVAGVICESQFKLVDMVFKALGK